MKRTFCILLICLLALSGCMPPVQTPETTPIATLQPVPTTPAPTTPAPTTPAPTTPVPEPADEDFVKISDHLPGVFVHLPYATAENFTGQVIYDFTQPWLRYGTVKKLALVQEELRAMGYSLLIWDGFRPISAQEALWAICPDPTYVANPYTGGSSHCRGNTVDITLVRLDGSPVEMPTGFDDFSKQADRDYSDCTPQAAANAKLLEDIMKRNGFKPYYGEWWHFSDTQTYPFDKTFQPAD